MRATSLSRDSPPITTHQSINDNQSVTTYKEINDAHHDFQLQLLWIKQV